MRSVRLTILLSFTAACCWTAPRLHAADAPLAAKEASANAGIDPAAAQFFEQKVRPLLIAKCVECHGPDKQKSSLRLDSRQAILDGGDSGPVVQPSEPMKSMLMEVIGYRGDIKMPPKSKLSEAEIADLTNWVKMGAPWPNSKPSPPPASTAAPAGITDEQKTFWAFQPITDPEPPQVKNEAWIQSPFDRFILAELEAKGIQPAPPADPATLLRRVTFDLTGLPPTPTEIEGFLSDRAPGALGRVVDRLLDSPRYGERWGRHWLDVARYADSNGLDENLAYANAYHYRDYVVRALNQDKPFNEFLREQIAGDLLPAADGNHILQQDRLTATGFLCLGAKMLAEDDPVKMQMDIIDEQVDTICRAFLGLTMGCARCHDHKFDPLSQADYYALAGIFKSTKTMENFSVVARWQERPLATPEELTARQAHQTRIDEQATAVQKLITQGQQPVLTAARQHLGLYLLAATREQQIAKFVASATPRGNDLLAKELPGAIFIEAEDYQRGNVTKDRETYGKDIGVLVNKGPTPNFAEYDLQIPQAADYQIEIRYAALAARPSKLFLDGDLLTAEVTSQTTGSWTPESQTWFAEAVIRIPAGAHVLRLENPGPFPHIDKLLLTPVAALPGEIVELPTTDYKLLAPFTRQISVALEKSSDDRQSVWTAWHQFRTEQKLTPNPEHAGNLTARLLADTQPENLNDLARRYQKLVDQVTADSPTDPSQPAQEGSAKDSEPAGLQAVREVINDPEGIFKVLPEIESSYSPMVLAAVKDAREQLKQLEQTLPKFTEVMAVSDQTAENLKIHLRGSHLTLGEEVVRRFPLIISDSDQPPLGADRSGRLELADWLTRPDHPLTARVIVNRVWLWHFGEGLVRSPDNFGRLGERPTHPLLLDWLAKRCVEQGWSLKQLHRLLILSSTYQMSTTYNDVAAQQDPENRLWWRRNRQRLEVEELRDSLLAISGGLDEAMGGTSLPTDNRKYVTSTASVNPVMYQTNRRSIYLPVVRSALYDLFQAFDFADPSVLNGRRDQTTVAPQALFMMNSAFVLEQSQRLAESLLARTELDPAGRLNVLYVRVYGRPPTAAEIARDLSYLDRFEKSVGDQFPGAEIPQRAWRSLCRAVFAANEFLFVE